MKDQQYPQGHNAGPHYDKPMLGRAGTNEYRYQPEQAVTEEDAPTPLRTLPDWLYGYNCILDQLNAQLDVLEDRASYLLAPAPKASIGSLAGKPDDADTPERLSRLEYRLHYLSNRIDEFHKRLVV